MDPIITIDKNHGTIEFTNGDKFTGYMKNNVILDGIMTYNDKSMYKGKFVNNLPNDPYGLLILVDKTTLIGAFVNGKIIKGNINYNDGTIYEGEIKNNKANGIGIYNGNNGIYTKFEGVFNNSPYDGNGTIYYTSSQIYIGKFINGLPDDINGKMEILNNKIITGNFINGFISTGVITFKNGTKYTGTIKDNTSPKDGEYIDDKNNKYIGKFDYLHSGEGKIIYSNKNTYRGKFFNFKPHDTKGFLTFEDGSIVCGNFINGVLTTENIPVFDDQKNVYIMKKRRINTSNNTTQAATVSPFNNLPTTGFPFGGVPTNPPHFGAGSL